MAQWAAALADLGLRPGDRLLARVEKSLANLLLYLATVRAGGVFVPLNPAYTDGELAFFLTDAEPAIVVCDPATENAVRSMAPAVRVVTLDGRGEGSSPISPAPLPSISRPPAADRTISPPSATPPARPAAPRARCSLTPTSPATRRR